MKKIISIVFALTMIVTNINAVWAPDSSQLQGGKVEVVCLSDDISHKVIEEIEEAIGGGGCYSVETGEYIPMDCTVTVRKVTRDVTNAYTASSTQQGARYEVTVKMDVDEVTGKPKIKDYNYSDVRCTMCIHMDWLDRPGWRNAIERLWGYTKVYTGTIKAGLVRWGVYSNDIKGSSYLSTPEWFDFDPDYDYIDWDEGDYVVGGGLYADYEVTFKEDSSHIFKISVSPTIFD